jgi:AcrR family transcriptional regulator
MGIKERQERDRESVRRAILDAARDLFVTEGYQNVSIRKIAERIEYSPAAIYSYFASKDDIFFALAEEGFRLLSDSAQSDDLDGPETVEPLDRIRTIFWRLYRFSRDHPEHFALMFVERSVPRITREYERFTFVREMKNRIVGHIQRCIDAENLPADVNPLIAFRLLTMGLFGVAVMRVSDRLGPGENADDLARDVINVVIAGLRSGVSLQSTAPACAEEERAQIGVSRQIVTREGVVR